jgi:hypothetical protein
MKKLTLIVVALIMVMFIFPIVAGILTPPDVISQVFLMSIMTLIGGILALIISRFKSFRQTPESVKKLIIVFVCLLSITTAYSVMSFMATVERVRNAPPMSSSGGSFNFGNLWVGFSSNSVGVTVVCLVDSPNAIRFGGGTNPWTFGFQDGSSVEFNTIKNQTVWIDKKHRVTFLGPVLNNEDVSLMRTKGYDVKFNISSPDDLIAVVEKLRDTKGESEGSER